ncbi:hypothetical protein BJ508DRAFT_153862 [Ascobolus immersus RN42]|uniref:Uncharacterized protein n=1 Tax=Ascobolus immersus RN42 TaxID=1160509 RepID=A0A3N4I3B8_ASCIM|nr:hypothetical protein BJ508DRAFT_153862 [Ascobolus immersus RN42]
MAAKTRDLPASWLSEDVHREILEYIDLEDGKGRANIHGIIQPFHIDTHDEGSNDCLFPPPLRGVLQDCLLFLIRCLQPYMARIGMKNYGNKTKYDQVDSRKKLFGILDEFGAVSYSSRLVHSMRESEANIIRRWQCGLLRAEQFELLRIMVSKMLEEVGTLLIMEDVNYVKEEQRYTEMYRVLHRAWLSVFKFFGDERFRSERLEKLLIKYLAEEDVNWDVVRGAGAATRSKEDSQLVFVKLKYFWKQKYRYHGKDLRNEDYSRFQRYTILTQRRLNRPLGRLAQ